MLMHDALMILCNRLYTPANVRCATVNPSGREKAGPLMVVGWGRRFELGLDSANLRQATLTVDRGQPCRQQAEKKASAFALFGGLAHVCQRAGHGFLPRRFRGPEIEHVGARWVQHGVVSATLGCAATGWPGYVTRLSNPEINDWSRETSRLK
jgi:hypothetical protein